MFNIFHTLWFPRVTGMQITTRMMIFENPSRCLTFPHSYVQRLSKLAGQNEVSENVFFELKMMSNFCYWGGNGRNNLYSEIQKTKSIFLFRALGDTKTRNFSEFLSGPEAETLRSNYNDESWIKPSNYSLQVAFNDLAYLLFNLEGETLKHLCPNLTHRVEIDIAIAACLLSCFA